MGEEARRGGGQAQGVNPACPNAANPFHRCAEYCPVPAPISSAVKPSPGRAAAQNGGVRSHGDGEMHPKPVPSGVKSSPGRAAAQNGGVHSHGDGELQPRPVPSGVKSSPGRAAAQNGGVHSHGDGQLQPRPVPSAVKSSPGRAAAQNGSVHSDGDGDLQPRPHRRDRSGGSGGLPLYVFLREGSDGGGKKVDPRCPNAANPFHVCTDHCLAKMADVSRSTEGGKSPISLFSRHSRRSSSSSEDGSVRSGGSKKVDPKCPNAGNPFHECSEHCTTKMKEAKGINMKSPRKKGKEISAMPNWKVDPRCPNAGNPFHICAQYCFDHLNEAAPKSASKPDSRKGKAVLKVDQTGDVNPDCANASNPYHKCGEYCKRNGNR